MKNILIALLLGLPLLRVSAQQTRSGAPTGTRIGTATRLVVMFDDLERQLMAALEKNDHTAIDRLLANEFEVWTPNPPGEPIPSATWLQKIASAGAPQTFSIRQMAVRAFDDHAVASFVLLENRAGMQRRSAKFVVDVWARSGTEWKLTERYVSPVPATPYPRDATPTGKE